MCGRYVLFTDEEEDDIADIVHEIQRNLYGEPGAADGSPAGEKPLRVHGEIFPTQTAPVLAAQGPAAMGWGFPGFKGSGVIINARAESVCDKPMFREAFRSRRLVVPSHGFYEWRKTPGSGAKDKEKLLFNLPGTRALFMAGLYNEYADGPRFVVITTAANEAMQPIHHRMPVILQASEVAAFLRDEQSARAILSALPPTLSYAACL